MVRFVYSLLLALLSPLIVAYLWLIRGKKQPAYRAHFKERFAVGLEHLPKQAVIFHCASVGEVLAATPLIKSFLAAKPTQQVIVTCNTPTGRAQIHSAFGAQVEYVYFPFDFYFSAKRFINVLQPKALCILETELWLNTMSEAKQQGCKTLVLNARLSEKSYKGYKKVAPFTKVLMSTIDTLASHNQEDAERFIQLGLERAKCHVTGSIKFDLSITPEDIDKVNTLRASWPNRPVWVAGSTHPMEHEQVLKAHQQVLTLFPDALLIIAPRHPEQFEAVAELLSQQQLTFERRSQQSSYVTTKVLLADTLGELKYLYGAGDIAYIGGSLIERGGHNPLEAAAFSKSILTGPHVHNFMHVYPALFEHQGAIKITSSDELGSTLTQLFSNKAENNLIGSHAHHVLAQNQGAIGKTLSLLHTSLGHNQ